MKEYVIKVVSYRRPNNSTCNMLSKTHLNWQVFVYSFDPFLNEYINNYGSHVRQITEFDKANLSKKRQLVLDTTIEEKYDYCFMLDDDIESIEMIDYPSKEAKSTSLEDAIVYMIRMILKYKQYVALSASYNISSSKSDKDIEDYKCVANNTVFNMKLYKQIADKIRYNPESKYEDMEFTMDLILSHNLAGRLKKLCIHNVLQGGTTNDGLYYRFTDKNRFIVEAEYILNRYPKYKDVFEYDENHFKLNSEKLKRVLHRRRKK